MSTLEELLITVEKLRNLMDQFMEEKDVSMDAELIILTHEIDNLLKKYDVMLDII